MYITVYINSILFFAGLVPIGTRMWSATRAIGVVSLKRLRVLYNNIYGLHGNITELVIAAVEFDLLFCVETKVPQQRHVS